ncbi:MAG: hypothetical protein OHK93_001958 [Ramalina farinacea]|uniref:Uncharacterized protein n=1 Tax=Ramalina farinacea TaxID=258253 RepID=A0AA43TWS5_9LECA|nr:hypothetical protein [Ramalina farinacea]
MNQLDEPRSSSKSGVSADELRRLFGQIFKQRVPDPPSDVKYKYDYMATIRRNGMSFKERADRFYEDKNPPPVPPVPESMQKVAALKVIKTSETVATHAKRDLSMSGHNASSCKPCRQIFDGNGSFVQPLTKLEKGLHYSHWDRRLLERSARSCPLCLLLDRAVGTPVTGNELLPAHYEIVQFLLAENVYGIRFSFYAMMLDGEECVPVITAQALITIEPTERE